MFDKNDSLSAWKKLQKRKKSAAAKANKAAQPKQVVTFFGLFGERQKEIFHIFLRPRKRRTMKN